MRKIRAATFLDVIQINVKSKDADSTGTIQLIGNVVVVRLKKAKIAS